MNSKTTRKRIISFIISLCIFAGCIPVLEVPASAASGTTSVDFTYTGAVQTFTAPVTGTYTFEVWGAQGGSYVNTGGQGGYSKGELQLSAGTTIYIYVGGQGGNGGTNSSSPGAGGWNGGGAGGTSGANGSGSGGGGGTDMRFTSGNWNNTASLNSRFIVAGGGGGAGCYSGGNRGGGSGGGLSGTATGDNSTSLGRGGGAGTQTAGGATSNSDYTGLAGSFGTGGRGYNGTSGGYGGGGGGGGWFGGGSGGTGAGTSSNGGGGGGSGYIGGLSNASTSAGVNTGNGKARITYTPLSGGTVKTIFQYTGAVQTFTAPYTMTYTFEVWGAQGGTYINTGGRGGYSKGEKQLTAGTTVYIFVGGRGAVGSTTSSSPGAGGWNGGGTGGTSGANGSGSGGGGGTDIRLTNGTWNNSASLNSRFIVAGGGGGAGCYPGGSRGGGSGGGLSGTSTGDNSGTLGRGGGAGTQTAGGATSSSSYTGLAGSFGTGGRGYNGTEGGYGGGGGGGGWYGGGSGGTGASTTSNGGGGGGSGYIGGVTNGSTTGNTREGFGMAIISYISDYTVTLNSPDATTQGSASLTATLGSQADPSITMPSRIGHTFTGYWTEPTGGNRVITAAGAFEPNVDNYTNASGQWIRASDTILYAQWTANTYTVTLDGGEVISTITATFGEHLPKITPPDVPPLGFEEMKFIGYFDENGTQYYNRNGTSARVWDIAENTTLYARWVNSITLLDIPDDGDLDVQARVVDLTKATYKIDIEWGDMKFEYNLNSNGAWNPATHDYSGAVSAGWDGMDGYNNQVIVTNHSNADVKASFDVTWNLFIDELNVPVTMDIYTTPAFVTKALNIEIAKVPRNGATIDEINSTEAFLKIDGVPIEPDQSDPNHIHHSADMFHKVGIITVTIEPHGSGLTPQSSA